MINLLNKRFGKLVVISETKKQHGKKGLVKAWVCKCDCGKYTTCETNTLTSGHSSSCGCERLKSINHSYMEITGTWYGQVKRNAEKRGFKFNLTKEYLQELLELQSYACNISGLPLTIAKIRSGKKYYQQTTASLDRIDNNKGYEKGNVQFVHKHVNYMKWTHDQQYFIDLCKMIAERNS